jgi:hypothetical protein
MRPFCMIALCVDLLAACPAVAQMSLGEPVATVGPILTLDCRWRDAPFWNT